MSYPHPPRINPTYFGIGIPLGLHYSQDPYQMPVGRVSHRGRIVTLDPISYHVWADAVMGRIDLDHMAQDPSYWPPLAQSLHPERFSNRKWTNLADIIHALDGQGMLWHWNNDVKPGDVWEKFFVFPQGILIGNKDTSDHFSIYRSAEALAIELDGVSSMLWLHWYASPKVGETVDYVADNLVIPTRDVFVHALSTIITGMQANLLFLDEVH